MTCIGRHDEGMYWTKDPREERENIIMPYDAKLLKPMSRWRHVKTGGTYTVIGYALCSTNGREDEEGVVYWSDSYAALRYREITEFLDGRFIPLGADGAPLVQAQHDFVQEVMKQTVALPLPAKGDITV